MYELPLEVGGVSIDHKDVAKMITMVSCLSSQTIDHILHHLPEKERSELRRTWLKCKLVLEEAKRGV